MESPLSIRGIPNLQNLPPGCKYLNCEEAQNVLRNCATWRLPNGSVLAPFGGEIYQVIELPSDCGDRCSLKQVRALGLNSEGKKNHKCACLLVQMWQIG